MSMLRRLAAWLHLYVGLAAAVVLIVVAVSGSVLVFKDEIDAALAPELHRVSLEGRGDPVPIDAVVAAAREAYPELEPSFVRLPRRPDEAVEVWTDGEAGPRVYVDPYSAEVLGETGATESLTGWLVALHVELLAGEAGHQLIGASALILLLLIGTGIWMAWPRKGAPAGWRRSLGVRTGVSWRRTNYDLHRASGWWTAGALVVLAVTGASLVYHDAFRSALHAVTGSTPPPPPPVSSVHAGASDVPIERALASAEAALPGGRITWLYLPASPEATLAVRKRMPGEWHPNGRSYVYVDRYSGETLSVNDATRAELGTRLYDVLYPLHIGRFGLLSKVLYALAGLAPVLLAIGGPLIWWDRRVRAKARVHRSGRRSASARDLGARPPTGFGRSDPRHPNRPGLERLPGRGRGA